MPIALTQQGAYPLLGTGKLVNVGVAFPGEVWSNKRASGIIIPGSLIKDQVLEGAGVWEPVDATDTILTPATEENAGDDKVPQASLGVAMRQIMVPDVNPGSQYNPQLGPNEIMNLPIASGDWLRKYMTGVLNLTLCVPDEYKENDILGWAPLGDRPAEKAAGFGAWAKIDTVKKNAKEEEAKCVKGTGILVVHTAPVFYGTGKEAVLTCRFLRASV